MTDLKLGELKFKAEDFDGCWHSSKAITYQDVCARVNERLAEKLAKAELVFNTLTKHEDGTVSQEFQWDIGVNKAHTHFGYLVCVQEVKR